MGVVGGSAVGDGSGGRVGVGTTCVGTVGDGAAARVGTGVGVAAAPDVAVAPGVASGIVDGTAVGCGVRGGVDLGVGSGVGRGTGLGSGAKVPGTSAVPASVGDGRAGTQLLRPAASNATAAPMSSAGTSRSTSDMNLDMGRRC